MDSRKFTGHWVKTTDFKNIKLHAVMMIVLVLLHGTLARAAASASSDAPPATPSPTPAATPSPECSDEFVRSYVAVSTEIKSAAPFVKAAEDVPNLNEVAFACAKLQAQFPSTVCSVAAVGAEPKSDDFRNVCTMVDEMYKAANGGKSVEITAVAPSAVNDATALLRLDSARMTLTVKSSADLQKALDNSKKMTIANGRVSDLKGSLDADVRCTLSQPASARFVFKADTVLKVSEIGQSYSSGYRLNQVTFGSGDLELVCVTENETGMSLGDLRATFGALLGIDYQK